MHEDFKAFSQKPTQNFTITSLILKNHKKFSKTQKPRSNAWNMKDLDTYQVWEVKDTNRSRKIGQNEVQITLNPYIEVQ